MMDKATVGSFEALLHSRIAPEALESKPDPVTVTTDPPFKHVPGSTVRLGPEPDEEVEWALQGTVVVVLGVVVVVVLDVVVVVVLDVVVLVVVPLPPVIVAVSIVSGLALVHENPGSAVPFRFRVTV